MTGTLISLISILIGIIAANLFAYFNKKYTFGFTGNTMVGVFGSIFFIKSFGRLGFNPWSIMNEGDFNVILLAINLIVSAIGGALGLLFVYWLKRKLSVK